MRISSCKVIFFLALTFARADAAQPSRNAFDWSFESVFELGKDTDAFSSVACIGRHICLAGKRSWADFSPALAVYRSLDDGAHWAPTVNPESLSGSHVYFFGFHDAIVLAGTGDRGDVSLMRSNDAGAIWQLVLSAEKIATLSGSDRIAAVFSPLYFGNKRWLVNLRNDQRRRTSNIYFLESVDDGVTWHAFQTRGLNCSARKVMKTSDGTLVYSGFAGGIWTSNDQGSSWVLRQPCNAFSGQADLGGGTYLVGTYDSGHFPTTISIYKSENFGIHWSKKLSVPVESETAYFRSIIKVSGTEIIAFASSSEFSQDDRQARAYVSHDNGETWADAGEPYRNRFGNMNAIYDATLTEDGHLLTVAQPDSDILRSVLPVTCSCEDPARAGSGGKTRL